MKYTSVKILALLSTICVLLIGTPTFAATKYTNTTNFFGKGTPFYVASMPDNFSTLSLPLPGDKDISAKTLTVAATVTSKTRTIARGQLCVWVRYASQKTSSKCLRMPTYIPKAGKRMILVVPLNEKEIISYGHLQVQTLTKKEVDVTLTKLSAVFTLKPNGMRAKVYPTTYTNNDGQSDVVVPATTPVPTARVGATTLALNNNAVLIVGGSVNGVRVDSADLYDLNSKTLTTLGSIGHYGPVAATVMNNGNVLITGGYVGVSGGNENLYVTVYSPLTRTFRVIPNLLLAHAPTAAVVLSDKEVLLLEGASNCDSSGKTTPYRGEIFHPLNEIITPSGVLGGSVGTLLQEGQVLVRGFKGCVANAVTGAFSTLYSDDAKVYTAGSNSIEGTGSSYAYPNAGRQGPPPRAGIKLKNGNLFFADYDKSTGYTVFQTFVYTGGGNFVTDAQPLNDDAGMPLYEDQNGKIVLYDTTRGIYSIYDPATKAITANTSPADAARVILIPNNDKNFVVVKK